jgi:hypothetical protein
MCTCINLSVDKFSPGDTLPCRMNRPSLLYPAVLEHSAAFLRKSPWEVSRDATLLYQAHAAAHQAYRHSPVTCGIDVYHTEVEAWGVMVAVSASGTTPALAGPLFDDPAPIPGLPPLDVQSSGRFPLLLEAATRLVAQFPGAEVQVPLAGPFSIAVGLLGFETVLMELAEDSETMREAITFLAQHQAALCRQLLSQGLRPVFYESGAAPPLVSPDIFREVVAPALKVILAPGLAAGTPTPCIIGGNLAGVAEDLFNAGPGMVICPEETNQAAFMQVAANHPAVSVRLNMQAGLLTGAGEWPLFAAIDRLLPLALAHPRGILGTGVVPYDCDPARIRAAQQYTAGGIKRATALTV